MRKIRVSAPVETCFLHLLGLLGFLCVGVQVLSVRVQLSKAESTTISAFKRVFTRKCRMCAAQTVVQSV